MSLKFPYSNSSLLGALIRNESGGKNIVQGDIGDINNKTGDLAKGYFQITTGTWHDFARAAGVDTSQYPDALSAPYNVQAQVASVIPLGRWGPNTIKAMRATGKPINTKMSLGDNLRAQGEGFGGPQQGPTQSGATLDYGHPQQGPTSTGATLDTNMAPGSGGAPGDLVPSAPASNELAKTEDKKKSLGGLLGELQQSAGVQKPIEMPNLMPQGGGGSAQPALATLIQQYMASQLRGGGQPPPGGGPVQTPPQGGFGLG
jgi:hypothetical protein